MNKEEEKSKGKGESDLIYEALLEELLELGIDTEEKWAEFVESEGVPAKDS